MIFAFLVSFLSFFHVDIGGQLYITEVLLAGYLFFSIKRFRLLSEPLPRKILLFGFLWLLSQIVTDLIRETPSENYLRGWAAITFFLIDFCAVYLMVRRKSNLLPVLLVGSALGAIFGVIFFPSEYSEIEPWKFGYGFPITMLLLLYLSTGNKFGTKLSPTLLVLLGIISIYLNARSLGAITILTAVILYLSKKTIFINYAKQSNKPIKLFAITLVLIISIFSIANLYEFAAESGYLPEKVTEKYQLSKGRNDNLVTKLLGGRSEILISSQAVMDSPIIGHGSWPEDSKYTRMRYEVIDKLGLDVKEELLTNAIDRNYLIPTPSVIMQAWVWAGLMGAFFWLFVLRYIARCFLVSVTVSDSFQPIVVFTSIYAIWNLFFSPFGAVERIYWALVLIIIFVSSARNIAIKTPEVRNTKKGFK